MIQKVLPLLLCVAILAPSAHAADKLEFNRDIRPILSDNCFACHGFDEKKRKADLRLDISDGPEGAFADLGGYAAIVPGDAGSSELWKRISSSDEDEIMPPPDFHKKLDEQQKQTLRSWIEQGAAYQEHWSFIVPEKPTPPKLDPAAKNPIDAFIRQRLAAEKLSPSAAADRRTLIRRVTLDLTGLPPTAKEVEVFVADKRADEVAYAALVDDLMTRPTYGEHMARYWLDLARYADTHGLHLDNERSMWPYRDWVVRAFNENIPFDEFTRWQLAGDLLPEPTRDQLIASGFNRCNVTTSEGGSIAEEWVFRYAVDRTATAVEVWMGMTAGCAVCHDHKFDPISAKDFYSMYAFFHSAADPAMDGNKIDTPPILKLTTDEQKQKLAELDRKIAAVDQRIDAAVAKIDYTDPATLDPAPAAIATETVWFEDNFPAGTKPAVAGAPLQLVTAENGKVHSGKQAIKRSGTGVTQDYYAGGAEFTVPARGTIFAWVYLDPENPPESVMLQFNKGGWNHRAVWGAPDKIAFGKPGTFENVHLGDLPKVGEWVKLEFPAAKVGLKGGEKIGGYAFTQFSGTVYWDRLGVSTLTKPATDPAWSWKVWQEKNQGKRNNDLPEGLRQLVRGKQADKWNDDERKRIYDFWLKKFYAGARDVIDPLEAEKSPLATEKTNIEKSIPFTFVMADLPTPRESFVMERGAYDKPTTKVSRAVPAFLPPLAPKPKDRDYNRLDFANWLVSGEHPLTARVTVNRFWQQFFGTGLVKTSADFGSQGTPPSHPELLDWLAVTFVADDGWDMQKLVRRIVTSATYRQSSAVTPELLERDPENRLLARGPRFRLDAEILRDQALYISGLLVPTIGGKGVNPYQPPNIWEPVAFGGSNTRYYKQGTGDDLYRRSLYTFLKRTAPPPFMSSFDAPNREQSCTARGRSNTPLQALQLMNDIQHVEAARNFAQRMIQEGGDTAQKRITWAWLTTTSRQPTTDELELVANTLTKHQNRYASDEAAAKELITYGESKPDEMIPAADLAAYTLIANLILNLDETVNKN
jgi:hypothetical protein